MNWRDDGPWHLDLFPKLVGPCEVDVLFSRVRIDHVRPNGPYAANVRASVTAELRFRGADPLVRREWPISGVAHAPPNMNPDKETWKRLEDEAIENLRYLMRQSGLPAELLEKEDEA